MDVTFIPLALSKGAELRAESFATEIETDESGKISGVVYTCNGVSERQRCRNLFLCASAVEPPRLLLLSELANSSGQVRRNFMAHTGVQLWGRFDEDVRPYKGIPGCAHTHRPKNPGFAGGYLLQSIGVMPVTYAGQLARGRQSWGPALTEQMRAYNHTAGIHILGECLPNESNFLAAFGGNRRARIAQAAGAFHERRERAAAHRACREAHARDLGCSGRARYLGFPAQRACHRHLPDGQRCE